MMQSGQFHEQRRDNIQKVERRKLLVEDWALFGSEKRRKDSMSAGFCLSGNWNMVVIILRILALFACAFNKKKPTRL